MNVFGRKFLIGTIAVGILAITVLAASCVVWLTGSSFSNAVAVVQGLATVTAIGVGGVYAYYKLEIFREFEPHLSIAQDVVHRKMGLSYVHISVDVSLVNRSRVAIRIREASFWIQKVAPHDDEAVRMLYRQFLDQPKTNKYIAFPTLEKFEREWGGNEFVIEPGESSTDRYEFIIATGYDTVALGAFFVDSTKSSKDRRIGWSTIMLHNINEVQEVES